MPTSIFAGGCCALVTLPLALARWSFAALPSPARLVLTMNVWLPVTLAGHAKVTCALAPAPSETVFASLKPPGPLIVTGTAAELVPLLAIVAVMVTFPEFTLRLVGLAATWVTAASMVAGGGGGTPSPPTLMTPGLPLSSAEL